MFGFVRTRAKRVSYPLDDKVKAESYFGSGSDHTAGADYDVPPRLSKLVSSFLEEEEASTSDSTKHNDEDGDGYDSDHRVDSASDRSAVLKSILRSANEDAYAKVLLADVAEACSCSGGSGSDDVSETLWSVVSFLRGKGHNAAICKTRWSSAGGITAGQYEFIDVVTNHPSAVATWQLQQSKRYFVDVDFAAEFGIARPSGQYTQLARTLPRHYVGGGDELKTIARLMGEAAKKSLRSKELSVPPWRKNRYMQNKWFGPYNRTVSPVFSPEIRTSPLFASGAKCRWVGFDDVVSDQTNIVATGRFYIRT